MAPYDRAWDMGVYTEYMWVYDGICQVVRIPDVGKKRDYMIIFRKAGPYWIKKKAGLF